MYAMPTPETARERVCHDNLTILDPDLNPINLIWDEIEKQFGPRNEKPNNEHLLEIIQNIYFK